MDPNDLARHIFEGKLDVSYSEQVLGVTPELGQAMVKVAEATHVQPMRVVMRYLLAIVLAVILVIAGIVGIGAWLVPRESLAWVLMVACAACAAVLYPFRSMLRDLLTKLLAAKADG